MDSAKLLLCAASAAAIDICAMALMLTSYREKSSGKKRWSKTAADMELADQTSVYPLECDEILIGRHASADIRLADMSVSRYHAILNVVEGGKWTITDMGSKSGVYVNGTLTKHKRLRENDIVTIGNRRLIFRKRRGKR